MIFKTYVLTLFHHHWFAINSGNLHWQMKEKTLSIRWVDILNGDYESGKMQWKLNHYISVNRVKCDWGDLFISEVLILRIMKESLRKKHPADICNLNCLFWSLFQWKEKINICNVGELIYQATAKSKSHALPLDIYMIIWMSNSAVSLFTNHDLPFDPEFTIPF